MECKYIHKEVGKIFQCGVETSDFYCELHMEQIINEVKDVSRQIFLNTPKKQLQ